MVLDNNNLNNNEIDNKIISYFENYINNDIFIYLPDYINQLLYYNEKDIDIKNILIKINDIFKIHCIKLRRKQRDKICINDYINIILKLLYKINYYNYIFSNFSFKYKDILQENYLELFNNIIVDPKIFTNIYTKLLDTNNKNKIKEINDIVINIMNISNNEDIYLHLINIIKKTNMSKIYIKINNIDTPLSKPLNNLNKLNLILKDINNIKSIYDFINDNKILNNLLDNNIELLLNTIYDILLDGDIDIIYYIFKNIYQEIYKLSIYYIKYENKTLKLIFNQILTLTSNSNDNYNKKLYILLNSNLFCSNYNIYKKYVKKNYEKYINEYDNLINYIEEQITNKNLLNIIYIIKMFKSSNNYSYDIFVNKYYNKLINRLLYYLNLPYDEFNIKIINENILYNHLDNIIQNKHCDKIKKIILNTMYSYELNINCNAKVLLTSYNTWIPNQSEGRINKTILENNKSIIFNKLIEYEKEYNKNNETKKINWLLHYGQIKCEYLNQKFIMLPIQYIILELLEETLEYDINNIYELEILSVYSLKIRKIILHSLILSNLLILENNRVKLSQDPLIKYNTNLILLYLSNNDYETILEIEGNIELTYTRLEIINVNINSLLKLKSYNKEELYNKLKENIKLFSITKELYNNALEYMIKYDYIKIENDNYFKIVY